jgi:hypothetical protein
MTIGRSGTSRVLKPLVGVLTILSAIWGCTGTATKPLGMGDDLIVDVDATAAPPDPRANEEASAADSPFGLVDGPYGVLGGDAYAPLAACEQCACPSGSYCVGGGTGVTVSSATCAQSADGGGAVGVGCAQLPAACTNEPDCPCVLQALRGQVSCQLVCVETAGFAVYCPTP